jgi:protein TonB
VPREIFGEVANPRRRLGSQSRYTLPVSVAVHVVIAACVVIAPLMATDVLPAPRTVIGAFAAQPAPPPPPAAPPSIRTITPSPVTPSSSAAPIEAPDSIETGETTGSALGQPGGVPRGLPNGVVGAAGLLPTVPIPPPPPTPAEPLPVGGRIKEPAKLRHVAPVYPVIAQQARIEGMVIIEAIIGVDGRVQQTRVLKSRPLLDDAAVEAVKQWIFTPTLLNGVPVPVKMTVTVNFQLK